MAYNPNRPLVNPALTPRQPQMTRNPLGLGGSLGALEPQRSGPRTVLGRPQPRQMQKISGLAGSAPIVFDAPGYVPADLSAPNPFNTPIGGGANISGFYQSEYPTLRRAMLNSEAATPGEIALEQQILEMYRRLLEELGTGQAPSPQSGAHFFVGGLG